VQDHHPVGVRPALALLQLLLCALVGAGLGLASRTAAAAPAGATAPVTAAAQCDVIHGLTTLDRGHRERLHRACVEGTSNDADSYSALFRLVSSSGWHAGVVSTILQRHGATSWIAWADGRAHDPPAALAAQQTLDAGLSGFAAGTQCGELRRSEELATFLASVGADEPPEGPPPFASRFATCLGVPARAMEGTRLLTIRADGLVEATVIVGTRDFVHARRFSRDEALRLDNHRFFVVAVPEASPVLVHGIHENQALPVMWRGVVSRNEVVWAVPPRRSCLDLSVRMDVGTHLYLDGVRIDGGDEAEVCAEPSKPAERERIAVDQTLSITLDQRSSGLPEHEIVALTCERKVGADGAPRPVVRHASTLPATAAPEQLRAANVCEPLRLDLGTPDKKRVAVLGVTKLPGCEATPMWASDLQERVRHVLSRDTAHEKERAYANFSAYAEASEALSSLESRIGRPSSDTKGGQGSGDTDQLIGSAAREAWRQGIDTLLSLAVQCTPRGQTKSGEPQWSYSIRATSIHVSELFARGYHGRDGLDLEDFIAVDSVGFDAAEQQDASIGTLLDRVFEVQTPRFGRPLAFAPYRQLQTLRVSRYYSPETGGPRSVPEVIELRYKPFDEPGRRPFKDLGARHQGFDDRPRPCEGLVHRGARPPEPMREAYPRLRGKERTLELQRSHDDVDTSSGSAAVYEGKLLPPRPGWYLVTVDGDDDGKLDDAVCIDATARALEIWADLATSGGPLAFAKNGSRALLYLRPRIGWTRYLRGGWLGGGLGLGYGFTDYAGTRADWTDLDVAQGDRQRWQRHALLVSPYVEARSRTTVMPMEFRARFGPALDSGLVSLRQVDDELIDFRAGFEDDVILDFDLDLNLDLSVGAPLGPVHLDVLAMLSYVGVDDSFARSATTVVQDSNFYLGFGFMISGGRGR
jgi:hypothetical protein